MIEEKLRGYITAALKRAELPPAQFRVEHPADLSHGDYSTNVALILGKKLQESSRQVGEKIVAELVKDLIPEIDRIEIASAGFINFHLSRKFFSDSVAEIVAQKDSYGRNDHVAGYKVMVEYTDPNPFKEFHIGHLMPNVIGESISRLIEFSGAEVKRANYQGDVGLHVAKAIYGMKQAGADSFTPKTLGEAYARGAKAYEENEDAKKEINEVNKKVYDRSDSDINALYDLGRKTSLDEFEKIYERLGTKFDYYFFESETGSVGKKLVEENLEKGIFEKSDGAVVFRGEKHGLHTRVFLNSEGLPTYEAKDLGLVKLKLEKFPFDLSITVTANEQTEYFKVMLAALREIDPELAKKIVHIGHGMMRLPSGKMSSRTGNIITAEALLGEVAAKAREKLSERAAGSEQTIVDTVSIGAVKYSVLRQAIGNDIIFDLASALSFDGDSGPYLQYAYVRTRSILRKAEESGEKVSASNAPESMYPLERLLYRFPEVIFRAAADYAPHHVVTYLTELASTFNAFYAETKILGEGDKTPYLLALTQAVSVVLKNGLTVLGISAPEKM